MAYGSEVEVMAFLFEHIQHALLRGLDIFPATKSHKYLMSSVKLNAKDIIGVEE